MIDQAIRLSFVLLARFIVWVRPLLPAICFVAAWSTVVLTLWNIISGLRNGIRQIKRLHTIPCARCEYATDSHYIKCSVRPCSAFSEEAIDCQDFEAKQTITSQLTLS
ncbi:MAG: hypothetical protein AAF635_01615 [Cyanobacteria bacterium P01_C01_bin.69]